MKQLLIITFLFATIVLQAQDHYFSVGLTYQPTIYQHYNEADFERMFPQSYPEKPKSFNGQAVGLFFEMPFTERLGLQSELTYAFQEQKYISSSSTNSNENKYYYNDRISTKFQMVKLPIMGTFRQEIGYGSGLFLSAFTGLQFSFLTNYKYEYISYKSEQDFIDFSFQKNNIIYRPYEGYQLFWQQGQEEYQETNFTTGYLYTRFLVGGVVGLEFKKVIAESISIGLAGRYEYDFNNSENIDNQDIFLFGLSNFDRPNSHHTRLGLSFTVAYLFY